MERTQKALKDYALENSTLAQEFFLSGSLKLDDIRMEKRKVEEISELLTILAKLIKSGNLDFNSYETLRSSNPLIDDVEFRRILGMSEVMNLVPSNSNDRCGQCNPQDGIKKLI